MYLFEQEDVLGPLGGGQTIWVDEDLAVVSPDVHVQAGRRPRSPSVCKTPLELFRGEPDGLCGQLINMPLQSCSPYPGEHGHCFVPSRYGVCALA